MLEHLVELISEILIPVFELMGIFIAAVSAATAFWQYGKGLIRGTDCNVKARLAHGLALSLEFKMASEILKTVLVREVSELVILGAVILLRAVLSFLIHFEMKHIEK